MKRLLIFTLYLHSLYAFELTQSTIPLSPFGEVVYDIYRERETKCDAHLAFRLDEDDPKGNYLFTITPATQAKFAFSNEIEELNFTFDELKNVSQIFPVENLALSLKFKYAHTHDGSLDASVFLPVTISRGQFVRPGVYPIELIVRVECGDKVVATKKLPMSVVVEEQSQVMITETPTRAFENTKVVVWNFGEVEEEVTRESTLSVRANFDFSLEIESKNEGALVYTGQTSSTSKIPYQLLLGQERLDLTRGSCQVPLENLSQTNIPISFTLFPEPDSNFAGSYQDLILLSVVSRA